MASCVCQLLHRLSFGAGQVRPLGGSKTLSLSFTVIFFFFSSCHCCSDLNDVMNAQSNVDTSSESDLLI